MCLCVTTTWAGTNYSTTFESPAFTTGSIGGQDGWTLFDSPANVADITTAAALSGSQSLHIDTSLGNGDVVRLASPTFDIVGESTCIYGQHPATNSVSYDFWFRTENTSADTGLYVSSSLGCAASVRNTWLGIFEGSSFNLTFGNLYVGAYDVDASGNFHGTFSPSLVWGQWYHASVDATFVDGQNNDQVHYQLSDSSGDLLWDTTIGSWENYYVTDPTAEQSPGPIASNRVSFGWSPQSGTEGLYVDNFSVVPEPGTLTLLTLAGLSDLAMAWIRRRRLSG
jgi:hypothetical protein